MPGPANTLLIEGTTEELIDELAQYIDNLRKSQNGEGPAISQEVNNLVQEKKMEEALKKLVTASAVLNTAPEKEIIAAYNLLLHITRQAPKPEMFLPKICSNLTKPIPSSPNNGAGIALAILSTIFNITSPDKETRFHIFMGILSVIRSSSNFETLKPQLKNIEAWLAAWEIDDEDQRKLYLEVAEAALASGEGNEAYGYLIRALRTVPTDESSSEEARKLALRALKFALIHPAHFDFQDLTSLDAIQALRKSDPVHFELLEIFTSEMLDDFNDFKDEHDDWIESQNLDRDALNRKMRLLTLTSLAAQASQTRALPYAHIAKALQVPTEDVEMWVIDVIRAGLVEGKLSQLNQQFLIHRSTYRVFGENQWREVAARLDMWRKSLIGVLGVVRQEKENFIIQKEQEMRDLEAKANGTNQGGGGGGNYRNRQPRTVEVEAD
ncbi:eukaryotic translation initiation factor 3 subunit M [Trichodelitschia bisporula]|uniref:Eukaryotic translation initiation factor 3 subunit M n=1 Tax=Trichodelitschia bisporula TaxID=703511 RepID=A0A6G1IB72_9PEZI|nr:eukaryotic translation initiation factor 3 subunit M [Trichodelitschia bisporula]